MMKDDNEDDLKNKEDLHRWKAHGAGHIPLCGIFLRHFGILVSKLETETETSLVSIYETETFEYGVKLQFSG